MRPIHSRRPRPPPPPSHIVMLPHHGGTMKHSAGFSSWTSLCLHFTASSLPPWSHHTQTQTPSVTAAGSGSQWQGDKNALIFYFHKRLYSNKAVNSHTVWPVSWLFRYESFNLLTLPDTLLLSLFSLLPLLPSLPFWSFYSHHSLSATGKEEKAHVTKFEYKI